MKHKTSELTGDLLDAAAAKASGWHLWPDGCGWNYGPNDAIVDVPSSWSPSTNWDDGGPIIERERITVQASRAGDWRAWTGDGDSQPAPEGRADTPLIAAMRTYVASKLGEEVEL